MGKKPSRRLGVNKRKKSTLRGAGGKFSCMKGTDCKEAEYKSLSTGDDSEADLSDDAQGTSSRFLSADRPPSDDDGAADADEEELDRLQEALEQLNAAKGDDSFEEEREESRKYEENDRATQEKINELVLDFIMEAQRSISNREPDREDFEFDSQLHDSESDQKLRDLHDERARQEDYAFQDAKKVFTSGSRHRRRSRRR